MSDDQRAIFDHLTVGRLPNQLPPELELLLRPYKLRLEEVLIQLRERNRNTVRGIYIDILNDFSFNAKAFTFKHHEFVGINAGVAISLPVIFLFLLSQPSVFPEIGTPANERPSISTLDPALIFTAGSTNNFVLGVTWNPKVAAPSGRARQRYAAYLTTVAWNFLLFHELGHIMRCHLRYLRECGYASQSDAGAISMQEFEALTSPQINKIRRILEVDADQIAGQIQIRAHAHNNPEQLSKYALQEDAAAMAPWKWDDVCRAWYRSILVLFHIMSILDNSQSLLCQGTHPHPNVRMGILANSTWNSSWKDFVSEAEVYRSIALSAKNEIDSLVTDGIFPPSRVQFAPTYSREFREASEGLWTEHSKIVPQLNLLTEHRFSQPY
jgi:hypothetical protein